MLLILRADSADARRSKPEFVHLELQYVHRLSVHDAIGPVSTRNSR
jgi:hypothetical protein